MLKRYKANLMQKENKDETILRDITQTEQKLIPFQVYQIRILHPNTWKVFINPRRPFSYHDGFAKIDRSAEKSSSDPASLSIRWAKLDTKTTLDEYMDELRVQYEKKQRKNKRDCFEILTVNPVDHMPHKAYLMTSRIRANHSVYRSMGKEETICFMQLNTYCEETERLVIASIVSTPKDFEGKNELYKEILFSLTCH